jgi:hypothetical protein
MHAAIWKKVLNTLSIDFFHPFEDVFCDEKSIHFIQKKEGYLFRDLLKIAVENKNKIENSVNLIFIFIFFIFNIEHIQFHIYG